MFQSCVGDVLCVCLCLWLCDVGIIRLSEKCGGPVDCGVACSAHWSGLVHLCRSAGAEPWEILTRALCTPE